MDVKYGKMIFFKIYFRVKKPYLAEKLGRGFRGPLKKKEKKGVCNIYWTKETVGGKN